MGANLVPIVRNFYIKHEQSDQHSIDDGCVDPGWHKLLRFDFLSHNIGDEDFVVGAPSEHPEWFVESASHGHYHLKDFNEFVLLSGGEEVTRGYKQAFCLIDLEHRSPWGPSNKQFTDCNTNQGVSSGWADLYNSGLACQFIVIDDVPDGDYVLRSTTNAQHLLPEDTYDDNTIYTFLRIHSDTVVELQPQIPLLYDFVEVVRVLFGVTNDGGGVVIGPNGVPIPIDPWGPVFEHSAPAVRDLVAGQAIAQLSSLASEAGIAEELRNMATRLARAGAERANSPSSTRGRPSARSTSPSGVAISSRSANSRTCN
jgi:Lysyl oxidase